MAKNKKKKRKKKYDIWLQDEDFRFSKLPNDYSNDDLSTQESQEISPKERMSLSATEHSGFFFGKDPGLTMYTGIPLGAEGNILVVGGNGSGKSTGIAKVQKLMPLTYT